MESSLKMRMYFVILLGSSYCAFRLQKHWNEPLHREGPAGGPPDSEITYEDSSVTGGLFITLNEENKVATQCWLHPKSPECTSSTTTETCPCMVNWPNENNVACIIRFSPIEQCVASAMFQRKEKGYTWKTTWKMCLSQSEDVKTISELIRMKNEAKRISFGGIQFAEALEFHGSYKDSEFDQLTKIRFDDDFKRTKILGEGSFGSVQMCTNRFDDKIYAVKVGKLVYGKSEEPSEVTALSVLGHENVIDMKCAWSEEDMFNSNMKRTYIVMDCCDMSVANMLPLLQSGMINKDELFEHFMAAVEYLHGKGVIHRDLKPENVLLRAGVVKLADFGDAAIKSTAKSSFNGRKNYGSKGYTAPELTDIFLSHNEKVDIYGSGVVYFLLHNPRSGDTTQIFKDLQRLEQKVKADGLLKTDELFHEWSGDFDLLKVMIDPKPENRVTAKELLDMLAARKLKG